MGYGSLGLLSDRPTPNAPPPFLKDGDLDRPGYFMYHFIPGSLPAARTEPGEVEETPGRSFDSPQEAEEINLTSFEPIDLVDALGGGIGPPPVGCAEDQTQRSRRDPRKEF